MNFVFWGISIAACLYLLHIIFYRLKGADLFQQKVIFPLAGKGFVVHKEASEESLQGVQKKWFDVTGGKVESWLLADEVKRPVIIFAHGNRGYIDANLDFAREIQGLGYHLLLVEYPGYGRSIGKPSEENINQGFSQAFDWVSALPNVSKVGAYGNSLGNSVVARLSKEKPLDLLILKSGFASIAAVISKKSLVPLNLVINPFHTIGHIAAFNKPILLLHGKGDEVAPYDNALKIKQLAPNSELISFDGGHDSPSNQETLVQLALFFKKSSF